LNDTKRVEYLNSYLTPISNAIKDGANVKGYIAWSLMDSFEWKAGFAKKFGLYHVDFKHPNRTRTAKFSAKVYSNIVKTRRFDFNYRPPMNASEMSHFTSSVNSFSELKIAQIINILVILFVSLRL
jgi:Glycosyl hydrolase family 1